MTVPTASRRLRIVKTTAAFVAGSTLLAGCQLISPRQTDEMYDAGDGVSVNVGPLQLRNVVLVSDKLGAAGVVSAAVGNPTSEDIALSVTGAGEGNSAQVTIPKNSTVNLSMDGNKVTLAKVDAEPGSMTQLTFASAQAGNSPVGVPVVPATGYYADLTP